MDTSRLEYLQKRTQEKPDDTFARYALGMEYTSQGRPEDAVAAYAALRQAHPAYLPTYYQYGKILKSLGRLEEAREVWTAGMAVARAAGNEHTYSELAAALGEVASSQ